MATQSLGQIPGTLMDWAAGVIGISPAIVRAQLNQESGGQDVTSPAGAQGYAQFLPTTWAAEGCTGSPHNVNDSVKCYARYMYQLVQQFHGSVRDALAAYNAGPGNLAAGYGYADTILAAAGQPQSATASGGTGAAGTAPTGSGQGGAADAACALSIGGEHIGLIFGHGPTLPSACLIRKTEVRAVLGALVLVGGGLVALPGLVIMLAYAFRASGVAAAVTQAAGAVPGYGRVVRRASGAARARAAPAKAAGSRRSGVTERQAQQRARRAYGSGLQEGRAQAGPSAQNQGGRKIRTGRGQVSEDFAARYGTAGESS